MRWLIKTFIVLILTIAIPSYSWANYSKGLHLQLPDSVIDISFLDIESYQAFATEPGHSAIMLRLRPEKAVKLHALTKKALGESALWVLNGRVLSVEKLQAPIEADFTINHLTQQEAEEFCKQLPGSNSAY